MRRTASDRTEKESVNSGFELLENLRIRKHSQW